jgi:hypothetical protein
MLWPLLDDVNDRQRDPVAQPIQPFGTGVSRRPERDAAIRMDAVGVVVVKPTRFSTVS